MMCFVSLVRLVALFGFVRLARLTFRAGEVYKPSTESRVSLIGTLLSWIQLTQIRWRSDQRESLVTHLLRRFVICPGSVVDIEKFVSH